MHPCVVLPSLLIVSGKAIGQKRCTNIDNDGRQDGMLSVLSYVYRVGRARRMSLGLCAAATDRAFQGSALGRSDKFGQDKNQQEVAIEHRIVCENSRAKT